MWMSSTNLTTVQQLTVKDFFLLPKDGNLAWVGCMIFYGFRKTDICKSCFLDFNRNLAIFLFWPSMDFPLIAFLRFSKIE